MGDLAISDHGHALLTWQKSSYCSTCTCVVVAIYEDRILLKNSRFDDDPGQTILSIDPFIWEELVMSIRHHIGELLGVNEIYSGGSLTVTRNVDSSVSVCDESEVIDYDPGEWAAFVRGVLAGEFEIETADKRDRSLAEMS